MIARSEVVFRSTFFLLAQILITPPYCLIALLTFPFSRMIRYQVISRWSRLVIALARWLLKIDYRVLGKEHLPSTPAIILSKHQSAWETLAYQAIFPPQVLVLRKSLLHIPFFGWGLALMSPIAITTGSKQTALRQLLKQGEARLRQGFWVVIFPEGTRVAPGETGTYQAGGALLATHSQTPVVPVAHNAGELWGRRAFLKYPGTITVSIGKTIEAVDLKPAELLTRAASWIESEMQQISGTAGGQA
ncbi:MAG: lysophospholipid acyltransferase family protein [Burkholderiales bacterium]